MNVKVIYVKMVRRWGKAEVEEWKLIRNKRMRKKSEFIYDIPYAQRKWRS